MPVEVSKHAGFCMGVKRAVDLSLQTVAEKGPCFTLGELIHNPQVVSWLQGQGIVPIHHLDEIKEGIIIIRSHGVSPQVMRECEKKGLRVVDCTCPFVKKLHLQVEHYAHKGYDILLVGDQQHPEVIGTIGYAGGAKAHILSTMEDVLKLEPIEKALMVVQTTFPVKKFEQMVQAVGEKVGELVVKNTICSATAQRQEAAIQLAQKADKMIVVGGKNSANTKKLYEVCKGICPNTILVECAAEIPPDFASTQGEYIGIAAGASTPDWSLKEVVTNMMDKEIKDPVQNTTENEKEVSVQEVETEAAEITAQETQEAVEETVQETAEATAAGAAVVEEEAQEESSQAADKAADDFMAGIEATMVKIRRGQNVIGTVVQITDDEVCVNIGYKSDGLIKKEDLATKDVQLGDEIEVEVVKLNDGDGNVILSQRNIVNRKAWDALMEKYENNEYVQGVGKEAVKGGLLADVGGVRAFVPASLLSQRYVEKIADFVGKSIELKIIEVDPQKKRIVASRRAVLDEQRAEKKAAAWERLKEGDVVKGIVRRLTDFGAFVDLDGVDGLIHITDLSWARIKHPSDVVSPNQEIEVEILSLDPEKERIQLGYKQLHAHPWENAAEKYPVGVIVKGKVVRITTFGAFVELEPGVDGLVHISQLSPKRVQKVEDVVSAGQEVDVKVLNVDPEARRISLSIREAMEDLGIAYDDYEEEAYEVQEEVAEAVEEMVETAEETNEETEEVVEAAEEIQEEAALEQEENNEN